MVQREKEAMEEAWAGMGLPEECWEGFAVVWADGGCRHQREMEWELDEE